MPSEKLPCFTYWEGPRTPLVNLCLESLVRHHPTLRVLDPASVAHLGGQAVLDATHGELIQYRSDLLRFWLMREFGGAWFDADIIAFRPTGLMSDLLSNAAYEVAGYYVPRQRGPGGHLLGDQHFCFRRGELADTAYLACLAALNGRSGSYGDANRHALNEVWRRFPSRVSRVAHWLYARIPFHNPWRLMLTGRDGDFRKRPELWPSSGQKPFSVHLSGYVVHSFGHLSREQLLNSQTLLGFYLRQAAVG